MEGTTPPSTGYQEFYTCVARVSELPAYIALSKRPGAPYDEEQVRAYFAQFPIGKVDTDGSACYAQYWRIPDAVLVGVSDGYSGDLQLAFPLANEGEATSPEAIDGLGTADVVIGSRQGVPGRYLYETSLIKPDGSVRYDLAREVLRRDDSAGVDLVIQRKCADVGGRDVWGMPIDRSEGFRFSGEISCAAPDVFASFDGVKVTTDLDGRQQITYYIWPENILRLRDINRKVRERIRGFMVNPRTLLPIANEANEN